MEQQSFADMLGGGKREPKVFSQKAELAISVVAFSAAVIIFRVYGSLLSGY